MTPKHLWTATRGASQDGGSPWFAGVCQDGSPRRLLGHKATGRECAEEAQFDSCFGVRARPVAGVMAVDEYCGEVVD